MASSSSASRRHGASEWKEKFHKLIYSQMNNPGVTFNDLKSDIMTLLRLTRDLLKDARATQHIAKGIVRGPLFSVLHDLGGTEVGENMIFYPSEHHSEVASAFWEAVHMFPDFQYLASQLTALDVRLPSVSTAADLIQDTSLPSMLTATSGFQSGTGQGLPRPMFEGSVVSSSGGWSKQDEWSSSLQPSHSVQDPFSSGSGIVVTGSGKVSPPSTGIELPSAQMPVYDGRVTFTAQGQKIVLMQNFAFHLFFMVTRMPYQVLGAQCNDLNHEYMSGGISGLFDVVTQYIEKAAAGLQLWSDETHVASNRLRPRYEQIKKMVQRSLEEVKSENVPTDIGGQRYGFIQREADQLTRDMRVHLQVADPHIIFIFDFHRKVAVLNSRWSAVLNRFEANLSPMEMRIFRNEAREFVVMTRSVPNIFTPLYVVAIQGARYHCSRFQLSQQSDSQEFGLQLTFIRFLSDRMRTNLEPGNCAVQFIKLYVPQDVPYNDRLLELYEAGLLTIQDLHAENSSSSSLRGAGINDDPELQKVLELSKQDMQMKPSQDTEFDEEYQLAIALSLSEKEAGELAKPSHKQTPSGQSNEPSNQEFSKLDTSVERDTGHQTVDEFLITSSSGKAIVDVTVRLGQNPRFLAFHHEAIKDGLVEGCFLRIDVVGRDRVGKTSLARSLLSEKFEKDQNSTEGVQSIEVSVKVAHNWKKSEIRGHDMQEMCNHAKAVATVQKLQGYKKSDKIRTIDSAISLTGDMKFETGLHSSIRSHEDTSLPGSSFSDTMVPNTQECSTEMVRLRMDEFVQKSLPNTKPRSLSDMSNTIKELIARYYTGELSLEVKSDQLHVTVFDFGGHSTYRPSHTPFLSQKGLKLVVLKMSDRLGDDCSTSVFKSCHYDCPQKWGNLCVTNWEVVEEWLSHVHVTAGDEPRTLPSVQGSSVPAVILVATHIDEADEQLKKDQEKFVNEQLKGKPYAKHVVPINDHVLVGVDNRKSGEGGDENISYLKQTIERIARDMKTNVPLRWLQLACAVIELRKMKSDTSQPSEPVVALEDLRYVADCLQLVNGESDFKSAVEFLSDNGVVVSRPMQRTRTKQVMIIIDPQWLTTQFCKILTVHYRCKLHKRFLEDLDNLEDKGILSQKFASHLLNCADEEVILEYMEAYNLICPYESPSHVKKHASLFLSEMSADEVDLYDLEIFSSPSVIESPAFFVPSMLRPCKPPDIDVPQHRDTVTHLWFRLLNCRIPDQAFYQLLALLVKKYPFLPQLFYREGIFNVRPGHRLHLVSEVRFLRLSMYIREDDFGQHTKDMCDEVRQTIQNGLSDSMKKDLPGLSRLQRGIRPVALKDKNLDFEFALVKKRRRGKTHYVCTDRGEIIPCPDQLTFWFKDMQSTDTGGDSQGIGSPPVNKENHLRANSSVKMLFERGEPVFLLKATALLLDGEQSSSTQAREQCAGAEYGGWRSLWKYLLKEEPPAKVESRSPTVLIIKAWIDMTGEDATIATLISAFSAIKRNDAASFFVWFMNRSQDFYDHYTEATGKYVVTGLCPTLNVNKHYNTYINRAPSSESVVDQHGYHSSDSTTQ